MGAATPRRSRAAGRGALGSLGLAVAHRRRDLRLTQPDLADLAGVSTGTVHAVEAGKGTMRIDRLMAVLHALGLELVAVPRSQARALADEGSGTLLAPAPQRAADGGQ